MDEEAEAKAMLAGLDSEVKRRTMWAWWLRISIGLYFLLFLALIVVDPNPSWLVAVKNIVGVVGIIGVWGYMEARVSVLEEGIALVTKALALERRIR